MHNNYIYIYNTCNSYVLIVTSLIIYIYIYTTMSINNTILGVVDVVDFDVDVDE